MGGLHRLAASGLCFLNLSYRQKSSAQCAVQLAVEPLGGHLHSFFRGLLPAMNAFPLE